MWPNAERRPRAESGAHDDGHDVSTRVQAGAANGRYPLDARGLAARLRAYGIRSDNLPRDDGGARLKGYSAASLADAWMRYVPGARTSAPSAPPLQPQVTALLGGADTDAGADTSAPPIPSAPPKDALTSTDADGADGADLREPDAMCPGCGLPLDPALIAAGFTTHGGDCGPDGQL